MRGEDGIADFCKMRGKRESSELILYAFDLLEVDGEDIGADQFGPNRLR